MIRQLDVQAVAPPPEQAALVNEVVGKAGLSVGLVMSDYPLSFVWGFRHSKLILSSGLLRALSSAELTGVLEHEVAHHARRDNMIKFLGNKQLAGFSERDLLSQLFEELRAKIVFQLAHAHGNTRLGLGEPPHPRA